MAVSMTYGSYAFDPVPQLTLSLEHIRDEAGNLINIRHRASLAGKVVSLGKENQGPATLLALQDDMRVALSDCSGCQLFEFSCDGTTLISAYATVNSLTFSPSNDNWVFTSNFNAELEWNALSDSILMSGAVESGIDTSCYTCIVSANEGWDFSPVDTPVKYIASCSGDAGENKESLEVTHTVSAKGINCCISGVHTDGWEAAKGWVESRLGFDPGMLSGVSGILGFDSSVYTEYNHRRTVNTDKTTGDFSVTETWMVMSDSGVPTCSEDYSVEVVNDIGSSFTTVSVNGTIQGYETRDANFELTETKYEAALACWAQVSGLLYERANCYVLPLCPLRTTPTRTRIAHNPTQGTISYGYTFDSRPQLIPDSISEVVSITDSLAGEVVAQIPIIGRRAGPLLYPIGMNNTLEKRANITVQMAAPTGCYPGANGKLVLCNLIETAPSGQVEELLCCLESGLLNDGFTVYRTSDQQTWDPVGRQYQRSTTWLYTKCSGILAPQYFCT